MEKDHRGLGRCTCCFWAAVAFDVAGLLVLLIGVFVNVFFYDLLIYAGAIVLFLSLVWWVFWYSGNLEVAPGELEDDVGLTKKKSAVGGAVRRLSSRMTSGIRNSFRRNGAASGGRASRAQRPNGGKPVEQVAITMATIPEPTPHKLSSFAVGDVKMAHAATETSPT